MLSAFPQLFSYSLLAITMLRVVFGLWFLAYGYSTLFDTNSQHKKNLSQFEKIIASLALLAGLLTFIGLFTQIAILIGLFILMLKWYLDVKPKNSNREIFTFGFYIVIIGLALLFLGPGAFALDLPL
jgi:uncharacterized membrane protein YphA (DoxX/SURF4 family)